MELTVHAQQAVAIAQKIADEHRADLDIEHLILGIVEEAIERHSPLAELISRDRLSYSVLITDLEQRGWLIQCPQTEPNTLTARAVHALETAKNPEQYNGWTVGTPEKLLCTCLDMLEQLSTLWPPSLAQLRQILDTCGILNAVRAIPDSTVMTKGVGRP